MKRITIIGGGASGTLLAVNLPAGCWQIDQKVKHNI